jgi:hypothetical protein
MNLVDSPAFQLVAWTQRNRVGRWSFWQRGTGETMMQHHCRGTERSEPVDRHSHHGFLIHRCRGCKAGPSSEVKKLYREKKWIR